MSSKRDDNWSALMRAAIAGDETAYGQLLRELATVVRTATRANLSRTDKGSSDVEDIVQETLLAIHLKRHTWIATEPLRPWVMAIARNKLIDALRRRGGRVDVPIDLFAETLPASAPQPAFDRQEMDKMLSILPERQRQIVQMITVEGHAIGDVSAALDMKEGTVRVSLHRALKSMAAYYRSKLS